MFTCIKSLNRYNLRHSTFLYFKYTFLSSSFIYKFVHAIIFLFIERKTISCLSVEFPKMYQYWRCLIILQNRAQLLIHELLIKKKSSVLALAELRNIWKMLHPFHSNQPPQLPLGVKKL